MSIKIALLGFGTVASGVPFLLKENREKIISAYKQLFSLFQSENTIEIVNML